MIDLFAHRDPLQRGYQSTYETFSALRESFHRSGRLDDSNAKLDEVSKLFATYLAAKLGHISGFPEPDSGTLVSDLQAAFLETARLPQYHLERDHTIFGTRPTLSIRSGDESMASDMVRLVRQGIDLAFELRDNSRPFDILNEAFGHFVRDNFRSNIEDAQYMTPPEVTDFMAALALHDLRVNHSAVNDSPNTLTVLDPSCGVGSFLGAVYQRAQNDHQFDSKHLKLYGQDKVERMVRLATLNLGLFDVQDHRITLGNSLERGSPLDDLNGEVDVILTNPPFGARFDQAYIEGSAGDNMPFFATRNRPGASIGSELLFVDRGLRLLRQGGRMLIIVPDSVVSARGIPAMLRHYLARTCTLHAVIELPATTFAQAGTRTKTAILYIQKGRPNDTPSVFMGVSDQLGFQVSSRKGVQVKLASGVNDLPAILAAYREFVRRPNPGRVQVLSSNPSCVSVPESTVFKESWTPKHHSASRFETVAKIKRNSDFNIIPLSEMVEFCARSRKSKQWHKECVFISVRHISGEGFLNVIDALDYAPKTPGIPIAPGELLVSRINPRIPRVCVVPDLGLNMLCSSEFEVMRVRDGADTYMLAYLLQTKAVQRQIRSLTSGTSSSHSRIRTDEFGQVLIPLPKPGTAKAKVLSKLTSEYRDVLDSLAMHTTMMARLRQREEEVLPSDGP